MKYTSKFSGTPLLQISYEVDEAKGKQLTALYRKNLKPSQELFTIISCFEIALRNKIDAIYENAYGVDWLKNAVTNGMFDNENCRHTKAIIL